MRRRLTSMSERESRATKQVLVMRKLYVRDIHLPDGSKVVLVSKRPIKCRAHHHCRRDAFAAAAAPAKKRRRSKRRRK